jgi:hypothetical protein
MHDRFVFLDVLLLRLPNGSIVREYLSFHEEPKECNLVSFINRVTSMGIGVRSTGMFKEEWLNLEGVHVIATLHNRLGLGRYCFETTLLTLMI